ncbi:MAG: OmpA family protein [Planctomycetota bacterium]
MSLARRCTLMVGLTGILLLFGCGPNPDRVALDEALRRNNDLQRENAELQDLVERLRNDLAAAIRDRDAALQRARDLAAQLNALRQQLAAQPPTDGRWRTSGPFTWVELGTDVLFDSGKATLRPAARAELQSVVGEINSRPGGPWDVLVLGHTDTDPIRRSGWKDNLELSVQRGATVFRELQNLGLQPLRMMAAGQGEYNPVTENTTRDGKQKNRRVDIILMPHREVRAGETPEGAVTPPVEPLPPAPADSPVK